VSTYWRSRKAKQTKTLPTQRPGGFLNSGVKKVVFQETELFQCGHPGIGTGRTKGSLAEGRYQIFPENGLHFVRKIRFPDIHLEGWCLSIGFFQGNIRD
jgi:hypothetical protein